MSSGHYTALLPEPFRHKSTRVKIFQPQVILLDFHGTISERKWEEKVVFPYVKKSIGRYIKDNWTSDVVQRCVPALRNESFEQRFRHKYDDAPIIDDLLEGEDAEADTNSLAEQVGDFLHWQLTTRRETRETQLLERLVWVDGFKRRQIQLPLFDDVLPNVRRWRETHGCRIYVVSSVDCDTLKLLFENSAKGNLNQYFSGYVSSQAAGEKLISELYKNFSDRVQLKPAPHSKVRSAGSRSDGSSRPSESQSNTKGAPSTLTGCPSRTSLGSIASEMNGRPILFITDSGQEAKAASQVAEGTMYECLLINRPGNKSIRTYYLSRFQYIETFDDVDFI